MSSIISIKQDPLPIFEEMSQKRFKLFNIEPCGAELEASYSRQLRTSEKNILQLHVDRSTLDTEDKYYRSNVTEDVETIDATGSFHVNQLKIIITNDMWEAVKNDELGTLFSSILAKMPDIIQILLVNDEQLEYGKCNEVIDFVFKNLNVDKVRIFGIFNYHPQENAKRIEKLSNDELFLSNVSRKGLHLVEHSKGLVNLTIHHCDELSAKDFQQISIEDNTPNDITKLEIFKLFTVKRQQFIQFHRNFNTNRHVLPSI